MDRLPVAVIGCGYLGKFHAQKYAAHPEAALVAVAGKGRKLTHAELNELLDKLGLEPQLQELN